VYWAVQAHTLCASLWWRVPAIIILIIILNIHLKNIIICVRNIIICIININFFIIIKRIKIKNSIICIINIIFYYN